MNLLDLLAIAAARDPHAIAIRFAGGPRHEEWSYQRLVDEASQIAAGLQQWGAAKGDRVALFLENSPEFVALYLSIIRLGAIPVPINTRYRAREISHILHDCAPRLAVSEAALLPILNEALTLGSTVQAVVQTEQLASWKGDPATLITPVIDGDDLALVLYTSGTTGRSKGAMLSHNNLMATITGLAVAWAWERSDCLWLCLPLYHIHGLLVGMLTALASGAQVWLHSHFDARQALDELASDGPTLFFGVPTMYVRLVDELRTRSTCDLRHMRLFCAGSAPLAAETFTAFQALTGHAVLERYGMTETGMNLSNPYAGPRVAGSVGTPLPGVSIRIVGDDDQMLPAGADGELHVTGGNVFRGYWNDPAKTAESFTHDAQGRMWFRTGDMARQDPATGTITLLGRRRELIISGGFNIYPREVEETLLLFPGVVEAAVIGVPDVEWGELPVAYLVCDRAIDQDALLAHCRAQLAGFKTPRALCFVESLPRNALGKLQKHLLVAPGSAIP
jgi:malonyl-CoA/methylmalonyl-CoA synthetase